MATGRVNIGGTGAKLNLYSQANVPQKREGIWLQHDSNYANIAIDTNPYVESWKGRGNDIPYLFYYGSAVAVGTDIYLLGGGMTSNINSNYKYNTLNNTYTKMRNIPYDFYYGSAVAVGTDIYLFGSFSTGAYKYNYKYNTLNDTYTQMKDIPTDFITGSAVAIGTDIYLFYSDINYKYNTLNNTYTRMRDIPYKFFCRNSAIAVGTDIYVLGGEQSRINNYKYNTLNNTYTQMREIPYDFYHGSAVAVGRDIYLFGGETSKVNNYKYNTTGNIYTQMTDIPFTEFVDGSAVAIGTDIYLFGGKSSQYYVRVYTLELKQYPENTFVLIKTGNYTGVFQTELVSPIKRPTGAYNRFATGFNDAFFYVNGTLKAPKAYYGDGATWIGFK